MEYLRTTSRAKQFPFLPLAISPKCELPSFFAKGKIADHLCSSDFKTGELQAGGFPQILEAPVAQMHPQSNTNSQSHVPREPTYANVPSLTFIHNDFSSEFWQASQLVIFPALERVF